MTIQELNNKLTSLLKSYIRSEGYVSSGKLVSSIDFNCSEKPNGTLDVNLFAEDYILYLQDGELIQNFFDTNIVSDLIATYTIEKITDKL